MRERMPELHTVEYYTLTDFKKDLESKGWTQQELWELNEGEGEIHNGEMHTIYLECMDEGQANRLRAAGYPEEFSIFWCW